MRKILLAVALLCAGVSRLGAQGSTTVGGLQMNQGNTLPTTCNPGAAEPQAKIFLLTPANTIYTCSATNTWTAATGGAGVSTFSAGNLSPVFISSVANPTTTPALSFSLSSAAANTIFGNCTGSSATPAYCALTPAMLPVIGIGNTPLTSRGDLLTVNATPALARLALGTNGQCLTSNGSDAVWGSCTGTGASTSTINTFTADQYFKSGIPWIDVMAYNASGSNTQGSASGNSGSATVTLAAALDFKNGQGVFILACNGPSYATSIVSGGGTTTLVMADTAPCTFSGATIYHDDQPAFQAAFNAAELLTNQGVVYVPVGNYNIMRAPLAVLGGQIRLIGAGKNASKLLFPSQGPASLATGFVVTPLAAQYIQPYCTALLTGTGSAFCPSGIPVWFDLRDYNAGGQINGLAAFTAEVTFKLANLTAAQTILSSGGKRDSLASAEGFELTANTNGSLTGALNVAGTLRTITGAAGAIVAGTIYHAALTYDGSNIRVFLNGTQVTGSPFATTGTVTQQDYEMVQVGLLAINGDFPEGPGLSQQITSTGAIDALRLSSSARYTANFTAPTAKFGASDANTLIQVNWDNNPSVFTVGTAGGFQVPVYLVEHKQCPAPVGFTMKDLTIGAGTYFATGGNHLRIDDVALNGGSSGAATIANCTFATNISNVDFGGGRWGFATFSGIQRAEKLKNLGGTPYPFIFAPAGGTIDNTFLNLVVGVKIGMLLKSGAAGGSNAIINATYTDAEQGGLTGFIALLESDGLDSLIVNGGSFEAGPAACTTACWTATVIETNHQTTAQFNGTYFGAGGSQDAIIHHVLNSNNLNPIILNQALRAPATVRWTDQPGHAAINMPVACANSHFALSAGWGSTATVTAATGFAQTCKITITANGSGIAANPTVTDTFPAASFALPATTQVCSAEMTGGTGTTTLMNQTSQSATAPVYTFGGTPGSGLTYIFLFRCGP